MNTNKKTWTIAIIAAVALVAIVSLCGVISMGAIMMGRNNSRNMAWNNGYDGRFAPDVQAAPAPPIAPGDDRVAPQPPQSRVSPRRIDRGDYYGGRQFNGPMRRGGFGGPFAIIGGIFRLMVTLLIIGLALLFLRRFFFGRQGWANGAGRRWSSEEPPARVEQWHAKMHERMDKQPAAPVTPESAPTAPTVQPEPTADAEASTPADLPIDPDKKDDNSPVI